MEIPTFEKRSFYFVSHKCQYPVTFSSEEHFFSPRNWVIANVAAVNRVVKTKQMKALR